MRGNARALPTSTISWPCGNAADAWSSTRRHLTAKNVTADGSWYGCLTPSSAGLRRILVLVDRALSSGPSQRLPTSTLPTHAQWATGLIRGASGCPVADQRHEPDVAQHRAVELSVPARQPRMALDTDHLARQPTEHRAACPELTVPPSRPVAERSRRRSLQSSSYGVAYAVLPRRPSAVRATEDSAPALDAMADDLAVAVLTHRRQTLDRAFEAVEYVHGALSMYLERQFVVVSAHFAQGHDNLPGWQS